MENRIGKMFFYLYEREMRSDAGAMSRTAKPPDRPTLGPGVN
jgi:hypothetical protein